MRVDVVKIDAHRSEAIDVEIARKLMKTAFAFGVLAVLAVPLIGSGPYSPVRVSGQRNQRFELHACPTVNTAKRHFRPGRSPE